MCKWPMPLPAPDPLKIKDSWSPGFEGPSSPRSLQWAQNALEHQSGHKSGILRKPHHHPVTPGECRGSVSPGPGIHEYVDRVQVGSCPLSPGGGRRHRRYHCCAHVTDWETEACLTRRLSTESLSDLPKISLLLLRGAQIQIQGFLTFNPIPFIPLYLDHIWALAPRWYSGEPACQAGDAGLTPGSGRSPAGGNSNPLQCSCLGNPMDRGAWWATAHEVSKSRTN